MAASTSAFTTSTSALHCAADEKGHLALAGHRASIEEGSAQALQQLPVLSVQPEVKASISQFMSFVHTSSKEMSKIYLAVERRYNYTTPKTFLEQIKLYQNLLADKRSKLSASIDRLEKGLMKLQSTASQVPALASLVHHACVGLAWGEGAGTSLLEGVCEVPKPHQDTAGP